MGDTQMHTQRIVLEVARLRAQFFRGFALMGSSQRKLHCHALHVTLLIILERGRVQYLFGSPTLTPTVLPLGRVMFASVVLLGARVWCGHDRMVVFV